MARILSLDTTGEFGSVTLLEGEGIVEELLLRSPDGFAHVIYPHIERLLLRHGWKIEDVDCFAAASGPGSFTGVRVGLSAVKGLAEALGKPVVAVSNLRALALFGTKPLRATVLDARRGEVYGAVYDSEPRLVNEEIVTGFQNWLATLPREDEVEFISADFTPFLGALAGTRFERAMITNAPRAQAGAIARIAATEFAAGRAADPAALDANYVRRSDAELKWKDR